ncbi:MAG TPA: hypothetical protein VGR19_11375 [Allosphingosinicella sp.]|nr:hypothetical protein [Allosphingosinicella sp.]
MTTRKARAELRERHCADVEASQVLLRESIDETARLVEQSDAMLRRHRRECDAADPVDDK